MKYQVIVTVEVCADTESEAYGVIRHALFHARKAEIVHVDSEVISQEEEETEA